MALIWRGIFQVDDKSFVRSAVPQVEGWLRWKLRDNQLHIPEDGSRVRHSSGREITGRFVQDGDLSAFRAALFEPRDDDELRTTVTAFHDGDSSWAWVDLERWSGDAFVEPWVPIAPGVVGYLLRAAPCRRGPSRLSQEIEVATRSEGQAVAQQVLQPDRELPLVVVSPTREELEADIEPARERAREIKRRLMGIAPVVVLGPGAVTGFSGEMLRALGEGFDVYGGAIRTYLPGIASGDSPRHHRFVPFHRMRGRPAGVSADVVVAPIQRGACAQAPPQIWRDQLRPLLEPVGISEDEFDAELLRLEGERDVEKAGRVRAEGTLEDERDMAAQTERENDDLRRRVVFLERLRRESGLPPESTPEEEHPFEPDFCGELPAEVVSRLSAVVYPESQWDLADELDTHMSGAWARRAWRAFRAMDTYASAKADRSFEGNFREYCAEGCPDAIPSSWIALSESETTDNNERFRSLRTLPLDEEVCGAGQIYMPAHIKIERGGYPAPRIHFYDDTGGTTGKVHVGYFGVHLDNKSKN